MKSFPDEPSLVAAVLRSDRGAFKELVRAYEGLVLHIVTPLIKDEHDRADISQDVFLKVYEKLHTFRFHSRLSTWIGNIAYNTSINFLKKKKAVFLEDLLNPRDDGETQVSHSIIPNATTPAPDHQLLQKQDVALLQQAINTLAPLQKTVLLLFHQDELTLDEIAAITEIPLNTIKSHLFRARKALKEMLIRHKHQHA